MAWTEERIGTLKTMWEGGQTASQIAEALGEVSRNAVIGKAHRLGLQSRPSPVKPNEPAVKAAAKPAPKAAAAAPAPTPTSAPPAAEKAPVQAEAPPKAAPVKLPEPDAVEIAAAPEVEPEPEAKPEQKTETVLRSVGPGGFVRQSPSEQAPPATPAPPRRLVPAKPSPEIAGKTTLLDLNDRICKWPLGHPGEPDFHFCGDNVNPGFPYCVAHCGHAYQAQLPRRDRRPPPPLPFGGPRVR
mgnify:CR=1 FL=1